MDPTELQILWPRVPLSGPPGARRRRRSWDRAILPPAGRPRDTCALAHAMAAPMRASTRGPKPLLALTGKHARWGPRSPFWASLGLRRVPHGSPRRGGPGRKLAAVARTGRGGPQPFTQPQLGPSARTLRYRCQPAASGPPQAPMSERPRLGYQEGHRIPSGISALPASMQGEPASRR